MTMPPMLDCDSVMRQLWDFLDGELDADRINAIQDHLKMCERCHPHAEFERTFLRALAQARREPANPGGLAARVRNALRERGFSPA